MDAPILTLAAVGRALRSAGEGPAAQDRRLRAVLSWLDAAWEEELSRREVLWHEEPAPTGDERWDAMLAGIAEHVAAATGLPTPGWALAESRFLLRWWFLPDTPGGRAESLVEAPAALKRRGVFLSERDLASV